MSALPDIETVASLVGDRTRVRMLSALMDGTARTATELSLVGGVTASTASSHLALLTEAGLLDLVKQGRHRYYRIANPRVAGALEGFMSLAGSPGSAPEPGPRDRALRYARVCYDHLAGEAAVRLLTRLRDESLILVRGEELTLSEEGEAWCANLGIELDDLKRGRRSLCRSCLDWSERRSHLAGALGAAIYIRLVELKLAIRDRRSRAVRLAPAAEAFIETLRLRA